MEKKEIKITSDELKHKLENLRKSEWVTVDFSYMNVHRHLKENEEEEKKDDKEKDIFAIPHVHEFSVTIEIKQGEQWGVFDPAAVHVMCKNRFGDFNGEIVSKSVQEQADFIRIEMQKLLASSVPIKVTVKDNLGTGSVSTSDCEVEALVNIFEVVKSEIETLTEKIQKIEGWVKSAVNDGLEENAD